MTHITLKNKEKGLLERVAKINTKLALTQCRKKGIENDFLLKRIMEVAEKAVIKEVVKQTQSKTRAAQILGINRATLRNRTERYGID